VYSDILHKDQAVCFLAQIDIFADSGNFNGITKQRRDSSIFQVVSFVSNDKMQLFTVAALLCLMADGLLGEGADDTRQDAGYRCKDTKGREMCIKFKNIGYCDKPKASKKCMETCGLCGCRIDRDCPKEYPICHSGTCYVGPNPASCQEKCVADWTGGTPDCIKREACQRACNAGTCPEYNK